MVNFSLKVCLRFQKIGFALLKKKGMKTCLVNRPVYYTHSASFKIYYNIIITYTGA